MKTLHLCSGCPLILWDHAWAQWGDGSEELWPICNWSLCNRASNGKNNPGWEENERQTNHLERSCSHKRSAWSSSITWIMLDLMKTLNSSTCLKLCTFGPSAPFQSCLDSIIVTISWSSWTTSFDWQHGQWSPTQSPHDVIQKKFQPSYFQLPNSNHHRCNLAWFFSAPVFQMRSRSHSVGKTLSP